MPWVLRYHYNTQGLLTFVGLFFNIAASDGKTPYSEIRVISEIAIALKIPASSFNALRESFIPGYRRANSGYNSTGSNKSYTDNDDFSYGYYDASDSTGNYHRPGEKRSTSSSKSSSDYKYYNFDEDYSSGNSNYGSRNLGNPLWKMFGLPSTASKAELNIAKNPSINL